MIKEEDSQKSLCSHFILNKLKSKSLQCSDLLGVVCIILYDKSIFQRNKDIVPFLNNVFNKSYLNYVIKSRTLIVARITKFIYNMEENDRINIPLNIIKYFEDNQIADKEVSGNKQNKKQNKKQNANDKLDKWLKGL